MECVVDELMH